MKNSLKTAITVAAIALFASSCTTSKKQKCDAYGSISNIEEAQTTAKNNPVISEFKS